MTDPKLPNHYNGNKLLKREGVKQRWTTEQKEEIKKCIADPIYFITHYVKIVTEDGLVYCDLYKYQKDIVNSIINKRNTIICASRQCGKCQTFNTPIRLRNKKTGDIMEIKIGEFYEIEKNKHNI